MNYRMILYLLGWVLNIQSVCLMLPVVVGVFYGEAQWKAYAVVAAVSLVFGVLLTLKKPKRNVFFVREGFVTVALAWLGLSLDGAIPFVLTKEIPSYLDAVFEMASGYTTTGASILTNVEALSQCSLFWRSFSHWIGGMGVLVFLIAIVPLTGGHIMSLMKAESPGPSVEKLVPRVRQTAVILYSIYISLTILEAMLLLAGGMPWFDSITTAFATAGTGGFSIRNASIGFYQSYYIQGVITVFMIVFGTNFSVYYLLLSKRPKQALKSEELRWYLGIYAAAVALITWNIYQPFHSGHLFDAFHNAAFSVATVMSTTGFAICDFNQWPQVSRYLLFILMFCGAMAGSTGGGMKVSRLILLLKSSLREILSIVHPRGVNLVKLDKKKVGDDVVRGTVSYFILLILIYVFSVLLITFDEFDIDTSLTAVAATMNNIGPGLGLVGPRGNYSMFSPLSKIVLIFDMLAGRLELFPILVLFAPQTWKGGLNVIKRRFLWNRKSM